MPNDFLAKQDVSTFKIGDKVRYNSSFLGRVQDQYGRMDINGVVVAVKDYNGPGIDPYQIVTVDWSDRTQTKARNCNLAPF